MAALVLVAVAVTVACTDPEPRSAEPGPLTGLCPDPVVVQADWFLEVEQGPLLHLIGADGVTLDTDAQSVRGRLFAQGVDMGVDLEIRSGGEPIDNRTVSFELHHDPDILLGIVVTDQAIVAHEVHPTTAVVTLLDRDPMMILWDPETFDVDTVADLPPDTPISVFGPALYLDHLVDRGTITADQIDPRHTGTPDRFFEENGAIAQQGYATTDPYLLEYQAEDWGRPIRYQLIHDLGWEVYGGSLAVTPATLDTHSACLDELVPVIQRAIVDYAADPERANELIARAVARFDSVWLYDTDLARAAVKQQRDLALVGNGPDETAGNFDLDRVEELVARASEIADFEVLARVDDLVTNRFIDPTIGFPDD